MSLYFRFTQLWNRWPSVLWAQYINSKAITVFQTVTNRLQNIVLPAYIIKEYNSNDILQRSCLWLIALVLVSMKRATQNIHYMSLQICISLSSPFNIHFIHILDIQILFQHCSFRLTILALVASRRASLTYVTKIGAIDRDHLTRGYFDTDTPNVLK